LRKGKTGTGAELVVVVPESLFQGGAVSVFFGWGDPVHGLVAGRVFPIVSKAIQNADQKASRRWTVAVQPCRKHFEIAERAARRWKVSARPRFQHIRFNSGFSRRPALSLHPACGPNDVPEGQSSSGWVRIFFARCRPDVCLMCGAAEGVLYVGKARNLPSGWLAIGSRPPERLPRRIIRLLDQDRRIEWDESRTEEAARQREELLICVLTPRLNAAAKVWPRNSGSTTAAWHKAAANLVTISRTRSGRSSRRFNSEAVFFATQLQRLPVSGPN
jgi:hypothetical protein